MKRGLATKILKTFHISHPEDIFRSIRSFSFAQKLAWFALTAIFFGSLITIVAQANEKLLVTVPAHGGSFTEGIIGIPRFVNPVLATSDADRDLTALIYSGLLRTAPNGALIPDLAESYSISEDGLAYTFTLRSGLVWHDGAPLTTDDIEFTVKKIQDPALKSPRFASWNGISVEKNDERTITFRLKQPFVGFLENATVGILPKHLWGGIENSVFPFSNFNHVKAVGSGPYKILSTERDASDIPRSFSLLAFSRFSLGEPFITNLTLKFLPNEEEAISALENRDIDSLAAVSPLRAKELKRADLSVETSALPRIFGVFFNQNHAEVFANTAVRRALSHAIDKKGIVSEVFNGYAIPVDGPLPPGANGFTATTSLSSTTTPAERIAESKAILEKDGWTWNAERLVYEKVEMKGKVVTRKTDLTFSLATSDVPELKRTAELVQKTWEAVGAKVELQVFEKGELNQSIIRPRKYDALFFGEVVGREPDLFSFWHSSQRNDPGLNIALYANISADKLMAEARTEADTEKRHELYRKIANEISADYPAAFLYSPQFLYVLPESISREPVPSVVTNAERFLNSYKWYIQTEKIWKIFLK